MNVSHPLNEDRASTPPPPYELEDSSAQVFHSSHDPEAVVLDADIPYSLRGEWLFGFVNSKTFLLIYHPLR